MYYATVNYQDENGAVNDLFRFKEKSLRDAFVAGTDYASAITAAAARAEHSEQFAYWGNQCK